MSNELKNISKCVAIAIGRNEGDRLVRCLESLSGKTAAIIYVDSGSSDNSVAEARLAGAYVVELDLSTPFTAARARNAGYAKVDAVSPGVEFVQFLDGDCELNGTWVDRALAILEAEPDLAVVCGRNREKFPDATFWNKLIDAEWDTRIGEAKSCGGNAMIRSAAIDAVGGFREELIAGEEPELCFRLRHSGWRIFRLDAEMTLHDAAMTRFSHWWSRARRTGYTWAEGASLHGRSAERYRIRELNRTLFWGIFLPIFQIVAILIFGPWALLLLAILPVQLVRLYLFGMPISNAFFTILGKYAEAQGAIQFYFNRLRGIRQRLIEYK